MQNGAETSNFFPDGSFGNISSWMLPQTCPLGKSGTRSSDDAKEMYVAGLEEKMATEWLSVKPASYVTGGFFVRVN